MLVAYPAQAKHSTWPWHPSAPYKVADEDRGDVPKQLEVELDSGLESMQIIAMAARASSGVWRGTIEASIVWSFAARQLMVQRR